MNICQARIIIKEKVEDYLWSFRHLGVFCDTISRTVDDILSMNQIDHSNFVELDNGSIFLGKESETRKIGFGIEYNSDGSLYIGNWKNGEYHGWGYLFNGHICYYGFFESGAYNDNKKVVSNTMHHIV